MKVLDWSVANVINTVTNSKLKIKKEERWVNMCEALDALEVVEAERDYYLKQLEE